MILRPTIRGLEQQNWERKRGEKLESRAPWWGNPIRGEAWKTKGDAARDPSIKEIFGTVWGCGWRSTPFTFALSFSNIRRMKGPPLPTLGIEHFLPRFRPLIRGRQSQSLEAEEEDNEGRWDSCLIHPLPPPPRMSATNRPKNVNQKPLPV